MCLLGEGYSTTKRDPTRQETAWQCTSVTALTACVTDLVAPLQQLLLPHACPRVGTADCQAGNKVPQYERGAREGGVARCDSALKGSTRLRACWGMTAWSVEWSWCGGWLSRLQFGRWVVGGWVAGAFVSAAASASAGRGGRSVRWWGGIVRAV